MADPDLVTAAMLPYLATASRPLAIADQLDTFRLRRVNTDDGVSLRVFEAGAAARPTVLLVNALGVSAVFLAPLARVLARDWHVLTWESRGLPDMAACDPAADLSLARHARDAACALHAAGVRASAVVTYCSGANVALDALASGVLDTQRLCVISPSLATAGIEAQTAYQLKMLPMWRKIVDNGPRYAALVHALMKQAASPDTHDAPPDEIELELLNQLPFATSDTTYRYAQMQAHGLPSDWRERAALIAESVASANSGQGALEALVLHGALDDIIHLDMPRALAAALSARCIEVAGAGHFGVFRSTALHAQVADFIGGLRHPVREAASMAC